MLFMCLFVKNAMQHHMCEEESPVGDLQDTKLTNAAAWNSLAAGDQEEDGQKGDKEEEDNEGGLWNDFQSRDDKEHAEVQIALLHWTVMFVLPPMQHRGQAVVTLWSHTQIVVCSVCAIFMIWGLMQAVFHINDDFGAALVLSWLLC